jgi:tol-pal system protein YbgF
MKEAGKSRYRDLDGRLLDLTRKIGKSEVVSVTPAAGVPELPVIVPAADLSPAAVGASDAASVLEAPDDAQRRAYQSAYGLIASKQFDQAIDSLHAFIEQYPDGVLAGNAYYWLGEVYLVKPQLEQAKQSFLIVVSSFKGHSKVPDALYKLGVTLDRLQDPAGSQKYLAQVQREYPDSTAAKLARSYRISQ